MGNNVKNRKIIKSLAVCALSSSFILGSLGNVSNVTKASSNTNVESLLANLTQEQREALNQLTINEASGLQLSSDIAFAACPNVAIS
jgi:hypothetical protein